jgi:hypothetical protein
MHVDKRNDAQRSRPDRRNGVVSLEAEDLGLDPQGTAAALGKAQVDARHGAVPHVGGESESPISPLHDRAEDGGWMRRRTSVPAVIAAADSSEALKTSHPSTLKEW